MSNDYFAVMCEHMAATMSMLPKRAHPFFDGVAVLVNGMDLSENSQLIHASGEDMPKPYDLDRAVRYGYIADMHSDADPDRRVGFHLKALRTATKLELRGGRVPFLSPFPHLTLSQGVMEPYRQLTSYTRCFASYHARERAWMLWNHGARPFVEPELHQHIALIISMQFSARYDWHVTMRVGDGPRIALPTKPEHARKAFKARDLPEGRQRRAALRHWVSEHFRRPETDSPIGVRSHFRGADAFDWSGLACEIVPSEYDRDRVGDKP